MEFVLIGRDGKDAEAPARRAAAREAHLAGVAKLLEEGKANYGIALLDDDGKMIGSTMVLDFDDRAALDAWLAQEPYVTGKVWQDIEIIPGKTAPSFVRS